jgi:hypothetical protein
MRTKYHPTDFSAGLWHRVLSFGLAKADHFQCALPYPVVLQDLEGERLWPRELEAFRADIVDRHVSLIRWDIARDTPTQFVRFRLTPGLEAYIHAVRGLQDWSWSKSRPEDPTLYAGDEPILVTESLDGRIAVFADHDEVHDLGAHGVRLLEPLGVRAEPWPTP